HSRNGAGVPCASSLELDAGSLSVPAKVRRGYMASRHLARVILTTEPPAHCRLFPATIFARKWPQSIVPPTADGLASGEGRTRRSEFLGVTVKLLSRTVLRAKSKSPDRVSNWLLKPHVWLGHGLGKAAENV